jgi:WD40 repeat protein
LKPNGNLGFKVEKGKGWAKANQIVSNQSSVASTVRGTAGASKSDNTPLSTLCIAVLGNNIVTGASKNLVIRWSGSTLTQVFQHSKNEKGFVFCINSRPKNSGILSGSSDGTVVLWNDKMEKDYTITINSAGFKSLNPKLRSVAEHKDGRVLVGTRASEVIEFSNKG